METTTVCDNSRRWTGRDEDEDEDEGEDEDEDAHRARGGVWRIRL